VNDVELKSILAMSERNLLCFKFFSSVKKIRSSSRNMMVEIAKYKNISSNQLLELLDVMLLEDV
jgi:hypothetical protein